MWARKHRGAIYGQGEGFQGNSYAIPTKDSNLETLPVSFIAERVKVFFVFVASRPDLEFQLTPVGCGLAGHKREAIEPLFLPLKGRLIWPSEWKDNPMTKIDWNAPLEGTENGGISWQNMHVNMRFVDGRTHCMGDVWGATFLDDGSNAHGNPKFRIRNRPSQPTPSPELVERMVAYVLDSASAGCATAISLRAELEPPKVDPDLALAREIAGEWVASTAPDQETGVSIALAAIKRVRAEGDSHD